jgi:hypothetical protein
LREGGGYSPALPAVITDKALRLFALGIKAVSKAVAVWEPAVEDAARKQDVGGDIVLRVRTAAVNLCQHRDRARPEHQV